MKTHRQVAALLAAFALLPAATRADDAATRGGVEPVTTRGSDVFTWDLEQKKSGFRDMEALFPARVVAAGATPAPLPAGAPLAVFETGGPLAGRLASFIADEYVAGLIVIHDGQVRLERYGLGQSPDDRWTSFSVAKGITSTLVGAAIRDGYIEGLDTEITRYIDELEGTAYDGVTVRHLLTMTSGVAFNEDYTDPDSDIQRLYRETPAPGIDASVGYMRHQPRESQPGARWHYKTPETNLAGLLVMKATGKPLAEYLAEKIWQPYGMAQDATWMVDHVGNEQGGCCLQATLRDYARFGQFILDGARIDGESILPEGWLEAATSTQVETGFPGGYGYQWWPLGDGTFQARGIFGQFIHIDPDRRLVIAIAAAWPGAREPERRAAQIQLTYDIATAIDAETGN